MVGDEYIASEHDAAGGQGRTGNNQRSTQAK
jgi:hypothetical protein